VASWEPRLSVPHSYQVEPNPTPDVGLIQKWTTAVRGRYPPHSAFAVLWITQLLLFFAGCSRWLHVAPIRRPSDLVNIAIGIGIGIGIYVGGGIQKTGLSADSLPSPSRALILDLFMFVPYIYTRYSWGPREYCVCSSLCLYRHLFIESEMPAEKGVKCA